MAAVRSSADLWQTAEPLLSAEEKVASLGAVAKKAGYSPLFAKFSAPSPEHRARDILGAEMAFDQLYAKQRGVKRAVVRTAEMTGAEKGRIETLLAKLVGGEVELSSEVDPR